ncbi:MAG: hypothetical protein A3C53_02390 [Omnitrophica WOR_2 bacterium RIFCSPHIGHO2_02_FULL_68_15]|nr:MAG: hypothetical protein A3C53_02390 [Omnitrophica WOR_2 bacterium RIFCSPHIGHO2_02_FULL_68_15]
MAPGPLVPEGWLHHHCLRFLRHRCFLHRCFHRYHRHFRRHRHFHHPRRRQGLRHRRSAMEG